MKFKHRYSLRTPKEGSRPALLITNNGLAFEKVAVFSNAESVNAFGKWIAELVVEVIKNCLTEEQA